MKLKERVETMKKCFVIQPFDNDKYDRRYNEVFKPAIESANITPYRVDEDYSVGIPIEDIEKNISGSDFVFAEITENNPNVWYELGFAIAAGKQVVLVASKERNGKYPFDIRHRQIISYATESPGDFEKLENDIRNKLLALNEKGERLQSIQETIKKPVEGLSEHEVSCMGVIFANQICDTDEITTYEVKQSMNNLGFTDIATGIALRKLINKNFIQSYSDADYNGNEYSHYKVSPIGEEWVCENESIFETRKLMKRNVFDYTIDDSDDIPF